MWIYRQETEHIEYIMNIESGIQVLRSNREIWWVREPDDATQIPGGEKRLSNDLPESAKQLFRELCSKLQAKETLVGWSPE